MMRNGVGESTCQFLRLALSALVYAAGGLWFDLFAIALYINRLLALSYNLTTMTVFFYSIK
jgi:hypothetical protein